MEFDLSLDAGDFACEPEVVYKVNDELKRAWDIVENTGCNLFLTGRAGTGKTSFLKKLREESNKRMVVLAPTGVAAINAAGVTMHSFFQLPFSVFIPGHGFAGGENRFLRVSRQKKRLIMSLSLLVIDEISMVRPDVLDAVDSTLRRLRGSSAPFGGLQLLLIGDLRQLPPVVRSEEWDLIKDHYATPYFYESHALKQAGFHTIELTTVYRQSDMDFISLLNNIRDGNATSETLDRLNCRYLPSFNPSDSEGYIRLTTHNRTADNLNFSRLGVIESPEFSFEAEVEGKFPESAFPADRLLRLKKGAQVMFIKNDTGADRRFYNGLIGRVTEISDDIIKVRPTGSDDEIEVDKAEWEITQYVMNETTKAITQETIGVFRQYPLQLAWAVTIHKSQGLTFNRAIIDAAHSFAPGQTYVALSRCTSLDGLVLSTPLPPSAVITDAGINEFIEFYTSHTPDSSSIELLKQNYAGALLRDLFDFMPLKNAYADFSRAAMEYLVPVFPEAESEIKEIKDRIDSELIGVATKFLSNYQPGAIEMGLAQRNESLLQRIMKGCEYFAGVLKGIDKSVAKLPTDIRNNTYASRLNNVFYSFKDMVTLKKLILADMSEESFSVRAMLQSKAEAVLAVDELAQPVKFNEKPEKKKKKEKPEKKPKGYSTFETLKLLQQGLTIEEIAKERKLALSTICTHIGDLVTLGKISLDEVVDSATLNILKEIRVSNPEANYGEFIEDIEKKYPGHNIPHHFISLFYHSTKVEKE